MRLEPKTFFLSSTHPFSTIIKKNKAISITLIACAVFFISAYAVIRRIRDFQALPKTTPDPKITPDTIGEKIKRVFNELFEDSPYLVGNLPVYPFILNDVHPCPLREHMKSQIMKGSDINGLPFIVIKVDSPLISCGIDTGFLVKLTLIFYQARKSSLAWQQKFEEAPLFFNSQLIDDKGELVQCEGLEKIKELFKTGKSVSLKNRPWNIPENPLWW